MSTDEALTDSQDGTIITVSSTCDEDQVYAPLTLRDERVVEIDQSMNPNDAVHQSVVQERIMRYTGEQDAMLCDEVQEQSLHEASYTLKDILMRNVDAEMAEETVVVQNFRYDEEDERRTKVYHEVKGEVDFAVFDIPHLHVTAGEVKSANYLGCVEYAQEQIDAFADYVGPYGWSVSGEISIFNEKSVLAGDERVIPESGVVETYAYQPSTEQDYQTMEIVRGIVE